MERFWVEPNIEPSGIDLLNFQGSHIYLDVYCMALLLAKMFRSIKCQLMI